MRFDVSVGGKVIGRGELPWRATQGCAACHTHESGRFCCMAGRCRQRPTQSNLPAKGGPCWRPPGAAGPPAGLTDFCRFDQQAAQGVHRPQGTPAAQSPHWDMQKAGLGRRVLAPTGRACPQAGGRAGGRWRTRLRSTPASSNTRQNWLRTTCRVGSQKRKENENDVSPNVFTCGTGCWGAGQALVSSPAAGLPGLPSCRAAGQALVNSPTAGLPGAVTCCQGKTLQEGWLAGRICVGRGWRGRLDPHAPYSAALRVPFGRAPAAGTCPSAAFQAPSRGLALSQRASPRATPASAHLAGKGLVLQHQAAAGHGPQDARPRTQHLGGWVGDGG